MIEKTLINYLKPLLGSVPVGMEAPKTKGEKYVVLRKMDGGIINQINAATFNVECYGSTMLKAAELSDTVKGYLLNAKSLNTISSSTLGGESSSIDTQNKTYLYELVFNFYYY